jgi:thiol-disulfide isomerase/thioredoxin
MKPLFSGLLICSLLAVFGCSDSQPAGSTDPAEVPSAGGDVDLGDPGPPPAGQSEPSPEGAVPPEPAPPQAKVSVQLLDWAGVEKLIAAHQGKVVVVDLWSTGCPPCRAEFPNLVKLHRELGDRVACLSVSTDYDGIPSKPADTYLPQVTEFLQQQGATFENVLCSQPAEELFNQIDLGSIPAVYVFGKDGKLAKRFAEPMENEEHTYAKDIRPFVEGLLSGG